MPDELGSLPPLTGNNGGDWLLGKILPQEAIAKVKSGEIQDAKTLIALQWLELSEAHGAR
jgi:hypothetical protein